MKLMTWLSAVDTGREINDILNNAYKRGDVDDSFSQVRNAASILSRSGIRLVLTVSFAIIAIALMLTALKIGAGNPAERGEAKTKLFYILMGAGGLFLLSAIVLFIAGLARTAIG